MKKSSLKLIELCAILSFGLGIATTLEAQDAEMFKCKDAAGRITYSGEECSQLGLSSAGEIKGRAVVMPALRTPAAPRPAPSAAVNDAVPSGQSGPGSKDAPATPERRCFAVKTAKGTATRCNDVPE